jgi:predicted helicase
LSRKDNTERVFFNTTGDIVYSGERERIDVGIRKVKSPFRLKKEYDKMSDERRVTIMCKNADRNRIIVGELFKACEKSRKCLVLSDRLEHLDILAVKLKEILNARKIARTIDFCVGGRKDEEIKVASQASVIMGTFQFISEGFDQCELDTLFLASPKGDVIQSVGRILRRLDGKKRPIVVEFLDEGDPLCMRRWKNREKYYKEQGWIK